ncbi:MAG: DNA polymerase III subunit gamma/tau [Anaerolineae bacterium]|nr:DNA polymerase III subunit gamma/tau [Anaerolineae bacterium]
MAAQALYRKWRSQTFEEIVGQEHVTRTLQNALREGRLAHAYLFAGPRGTGKTSTARILAKAVNCLAEPEKRPCNQCSICQAINEGRLLDLVEIDAASNTSVDDIRDLRDKVGFRPNEARMKFYIIDEVHMLSNSAFNALLKTLEEPPPHVVFVLCTTEPHRIPPTVLSRCQRFDFRRISTADITAHLARIVAAEGYKAEPEALTLIARTATGSMRDAISLLDQLLAYGEQKITVAQVRDVLGMISERTVSDWVAALARRDVQSGLTVLNQLVMEGVELRELARQVLAYLRGILLLKVGGGAASLDVDADTLARMKETADAFTMPHLIRSVRLFSQAATELRNTVQPQLPLELAFVEAATAAEPAVSAAPSEAMQVEAAPATQPASPAASGGPHPEQTASHPAEREAADQASEAHPPEAEKQEQLSGAEKLARLRDAWGMVRQELQTTSPAALGVLSSRRGVRFLAVEGQEVIIGYQERARYSVESILQRPEVVQALEHALSKVFGSPHTVKYVPEELYRPASQAPKEEGKPSSPQASAGEGEVTDPLVQAAIDEYGAKAERI